MTIVHLIIPALWLVFVAYWAVAAVGVKRNVGPRWWGRQLAIRLALAALLAGALAVPAVRHALRLVQMHTAGGALAGAVGVALVGLGVGLAIWARVHLGRNWGTPMSQKEDPELVTGGPYAVVRHPIYGGIILAMLGTAIGLSIVWLVLLVLFVPYFIYSARREEAFMGQRFGDTYRAYLQRTWMLVPFVL